MIIRIKGLNKQSEMEFIPLAPGYLKKFNLDNKSPIKIGMLQRFLNKLQFKTRKKNMDPVDCSEIMTSILKRKDYVKSTYKGAAIYAKGFVYILMTNEKVTIGHDIHPKNKGLSMQTNELAFFLTTLNNFERINGN